MILLITQFEHSLKFSTKQEVHFISYKKKIRLERKVKALRACITERLLCLMFIILLNTFC